MEIHENTEREGNISHFHVPCDNNVVVAMAILKWCIQTNKIESHGDVGRIYSSLA